MFVLLPILFAAYAVQSAVGFAGALVAISVGTMFLPLPDVQAVVIPIGAFLSTYIAFRDREHIARDKVLRVVLPLMGVGMIVGFVVYEFASLDVLRRVLGVLLIGVAIWRIAASRREDAPKPEGIAERNAWLLVAGVVHGLFGTGGPPLVYALSRANLTKTSFRATLALIFAALNYALALKFVVSGALAASHAMVIAAGLPVLVLAFLFGQWLHERVDEARFRLAVQVLILAAGVALLLK